MHRTADLPANNATRKDIDDKGDIQPALPRREVREVRHPLVGRLALSCGFTLSHGHTADGSGFMVRTPLPHRAPCSFKRFINRSTVQRATVKPSRCICRQILSTPGWHARHAECAASAPNPAVRARSAELDCAAVRHGDDSQKGQSAKPGQIGSTPKVSRY